MEGVELWSGFEVKGLKEVGKIRILKLSPRETPRLGQMLKSTLKVPLKASLRNASSCSQKTNSNAECSRSMYFKMQPTGK